MFLYCAHCVSTIEDEPHFLLNCPNYSNLRAPLLELCNHLLPSFSHLSIYNGSVYIHLNQERPNILKNFGEVFEQSIRTKEHNNLAIVIKYTHSK